ncbi:lysine 2,3-aminomutase YodO family protein [sediment metagenome]|uniref:Lysine 2,3-aminomutase YodO family protein n=1 Tax=sediment metagenome TaxID=749907 RepID=D9PN21_9ZZZZ
MTSGEFGLALKYLKEHAEVRDVLISGGDPLTLSDEKLEYFLKHLRSIKSIEIIRFGTRVPVSLPQRITTKLCEMLKKYHPVFMNIHVNHPSEISQQTMHACGLLADAGIPLGSQSVLLKGINDKPQIFMKLVHDLVKMRVKPYYLYQCDIALGTSHFKTPVSCGIKIIENLRGFTSGFSVPVFVIDAPQGGGKIPLAPDYVISRNKKSIILKNYKQDIYVYPE